MLSLSERESLIAVRDRLQEEFDNLTYPIQWGAFMLGRVAHLEEKNERLLGRWEETKHRCPQCGCGNPIVKDLEDAYKGVCEELDALKEGG